MESKIEVLLCDWFIRIHENNLSPPLLPTSSMLVLRTQIQIFPSGIYDRGFWRIAPCSNIEERGEGLQHFELVHFDFTFHRPSMRRFLLEIQP